MLLLVRYARSAAITNMNALYRLHLYYLQKIDYLLSRYVTLAIFFQQQYSWRTVNYLREMTNDSLMCLLTVFPSRSCFHCRLQTSFLSYITFWNR